MLFVNLKDSHFSFFDAIPLQALTFAMRGTGLGINAYRMVDAAAKKKSYQNPFHALYSPTPLPPKHRHEEIDGRERRRKALFVITTTPKYLPCLEQKRAKVSRTIQTMVSICGWNILVVAQ